MRFNVTYPEKITLCKMLALDLLCNSLCGPLPKSLESPGLHELDRQSDSWEPQDKRFAFCGRSGTACVDLLIRDFRSACI